MLIKVTECSHHKLSMPLKTPLVALRSYYQRLASSYDSYLDEQLSLEETKSFLSLIPENYHESLLDVACGTGRISRAVASGGAYYVGLDLSDSMLRVLRMKTPTDNADLICGSATNLPFRRSSFAFVACFGLTGYFSARSQQGLLSKISEILAQAGYVTIDFLRPGTEPSKLIQAEEAEEGNRVYLLSLRGVRERIRLTNFKIANTRKTARQVQFLLRRRSGKD